MVKVLNSRVTYFLLFTAVVFTACKYSRINKKTQDEGRFMAKVHTSGGDFLDRKEKDTLNFMTFPFNVAEFIGNKQTAKKVFIVGKTITQGQRVSFHPFAKLTYNDGKENTVIVARPTNPELITAPIDNYFDLISLYYGVQKMIETWITYSKGFDSLQSLEWENEDSALEFLDS